MQVINIDTIGPLPKDSEGNQFVLTIMDIFTRYTKLYAIKDTGAAASVYPLLDHISLRIDMLKNDVLQPILCCVNLLGVSLATWILQNI